MGRLLGLGKGTVAPLVPCSGRRSAWGLADVGFGRVRSDARGFLMLVLFGGSGGSSESVISMGESLSDDEVVPSSLLDVPKTCGACNLAP